MQRKEIALSCSIPPVVEAYLTELESGTYPVNKRRLAFARIVRKTFAEEYLTVEGGRLENTYRWNDTSRSGFFHGKNA